MLLVAGCVKKHLFFSHACQVRMSRRAFKKWVRSTSLWKRLSCHRNVLGQLLDHKPSVVRAGQWTRALTHARNTLPPFMTNRDPQRGAVWFSSTMGPVVLCIREHIAPKVHRRATWTAIDSPTGIIYFGAQPGIFVRVSWCVERSLAVAIRYFDTCFIAKQKAVRRRALQSSPLT